MASQIVSYLTGQTVLQIIYVYILSKTEQNKNIWLRSISLVGQRFNIMFTTWHKIPNGFLVCLFLATSKVISEWVLTCDSAHS